MVRPKDIREKIGEGKVDEFLHNFGLMRKSLEQTLYMFMSNLLASAWKTARFGIPRLP